MTTQRSVTPRRASRNYDAWLDLPEITGVSVRRVSLWVRFSLVLSAVALLAFIFITFT